MFRTKKLFNTAALLGLLITLALFAASASNGFAPAPMATAVIWLVLTVGFKANLRWMAYPAFLAALVCAIVFYANSALAPQWFVMAVVILCVLLSLVLFLLLWKRPGKVRVR